VLYTRLALLLDDSRENSVQIFLHFVGWLTAILVGLYLVACVFIVLGKGLNACLELIDRYQKQSVGCLYLLIGSLCIWGGLKLFNKGDEIGAAGLAVLALGGLAILGALFLMFQKNTPD
jgi:hypothetical protein